MIVGEDIEVFQEPVPVVGVGITGNKGESSCLGVVNIDGDIHKIITQPKQGEGGRTELLDDGKIGETNEGDKALSKGATQDAENITKTGKN
jgi:hypothetical protein